MTGSNQGGKVPDMDPFIPPELGALMSEAEPKPNLCKDCRHYVADSHVEFDRCKKRALASISHLIRGDAPEFGFCERTRSDSGMCGPQGRWWEPK